MKMEICVMKEERDMEHNRRHRVIWTLVGPLVRLILLIRFHYRCRINNIKGPCIVVCNHVTDWDPILAGCSFRTQMYYVASEHLLRKKIVGPLVRWAQDPIPRQKSGSAAGTVMSILRSEERRVGKEC